MKAASTGSVQRVFIASAKPWTSRCRRCLNAIPRSKSFRFSKEYGLGDKATSPTFDEAAALEICSPLPMRRSHSFPRQSFEQARHRPRPDYLWARNTSQGSNDHAANAKVSTTASKIGTAAAIVSFDQPLHRRTGRFRHRGRALGFDNS